MIESRSRVSDGLRAAIRRWYPDPNLFWRDALKREPRPSQRKFNERIAEALRESPHVAGHWRSTHGAGKTGAVGADVLWWMFTRAGCRGIMTGPGFETLDDALGAEIRGLLHQSILPSFGMELVGNSLRMSGNWFVKLRTSDDPQKLEGPHSPHAIIRAIDEAKSVDPEVWVSTEGMFTTRTSLDLMASTPGLASGEFWHRDVYGGEKLIRAVVDIEQAIADGIPGMVEQKARWIARWGEDSDIYRNRAKAQYLTGSIGNLISLEAIEGAINRGWVQPVSVPACAGLDVGRSTDGDLSALAITRGWDLLMVLTWQTRDTMRVVREALLGDPNRGYRGLIALGVKRFRIDAVGVGGGLYDRCEEILRERYDDRGEPRPIVLEEYWENGSAAEQTIYDSRHAEAVDVCAGELRAGRASLRGAGRHAQRLRQDLAQFRLIPKVDSRDTRFHVVKKEKGQPSPDIGDAYLISAGPDVGSGLVEILREQAAAKRSNAAAKG